MSIVVEAKNIHNISNIYANTITIKYENITIPLQKLINSLQATDVHIVCKNRMYIKEKIVTRKNITLIALQDIVIGNEEDNVMVLADNIKIMCKNLDCSFGKIYARKNMSIDADCVYVGKPVKSIVEIESYADYNKGYEYKDKSNSYIIAKDNLTIKSYRLVVDCAFLSSLGNFTFEGNKLSCVASKIEVFGDFNVYAYSIYTVPCRPYFHKIRNENTYKITKEIMYETSERSTVRICGDIKCGKYLQWYDVGSKLDIKSNLKNSIEFNKFSITEFK